MDGSVSVAGDQVEPPVEERNPYRGLEAFDEADADRFFGRVTITEVCVEAFLARRRPPGSGEIPLRMVPILGPSGSGKSSVARAGLLPALARHRAFGRDANVAVLTPGAHPLEALAAVLGRIATGGPLGVRESGDILDALRSPGHDGTFNGLRRVAAMLTPAGAAPLVLLVDQLEEIYSLCDDKAERDAFVGNLLTTIGDRAGPTAIVTLRSDFLGATAQHPLLNGAVAQHGIIVPVMSEAELREAIAMPAMRAGRPLDEGVIDLLIEQTRGRSGALPLLQFILTRIWERALEGVPPSETVRMLGGVGGALASEAERIFGALSPAGQRIARRAFLAQVRLGEGAQDTRRRTLMHEIVAGSDSESHVRRVLEAFSSPGERLVTLSSDEGGDVTVELTHEALLDNWERLATWRTQSRADLKFQRRLAEAVADWEANGKLPGLLWRTPNLELLRNFHRAAAADMTQGQLAFLDAANRLARKERFVRRGSVVAAFVALLGIIGGLLYQRYGAWVERRPWATLESLATGRLHPLTQGAANIGRPTPGTRGFAHQVELRGQNASRLQASISRDLILMDMRSQYGTTVNAAFVPYGTDKKLEDRDLITFAGVFPFRLHVNRYSPLDWLAPEQLKASAAISGWGVVIDGAMREAMPLTRGEHVIGLKGGQLNLDGDGSPVLIARRSLLPKGTRLDVVASKGRHGTTISLAVLSPGGKLSLPEQAEWLTLEARTDELSAELKVDDTTYETFDVPTGFQMLMPITDKEHDLGELAFSTGGKRFQVITSRSESDFSPP